MDLTPAPANRSLFVPDPVRRYEGRQVNNARRPITEQPAIYDFIAAADAEFEIMNRGDRALQHGLGELTADEAREYANIQERKMRAQAALMGLAVPPPIAPARAPRKIGRNDPCHWWEWQEVQEMPRRLTGFTPASLRRARTRPSSGSP